MSKRKRSFHGENKFMHYYLRRPAEKGKGEPFACIMFHANIDGTVHRGISICSAEEKKFVRAKARGIAKSRLICAMESGECGHSIDHEHEWLPDSLTDYLNHVEPIRKTNPELLKYKSHYSVAPTEGETRMLTKPDDR